MSSPSPDVDTAELAELRLSLFRAEARLTAMRLELGHQISLRIPPPAPEPVVIRMVDPVELDETVRQRDAEIALLRGLLAAHRSSAFWRASAPLRRLLRNRPGLARAGRRALRAVWWTLTMQWGRRLRARAAYRRDLLSAPMIAAPTIVLPEPVSVPDVPDVPRIGLVLPTSETPLVSIVIPAYGQVPVTLRCLHAIARSETLTPFEVIVAEDASGDQEVALLDQVVGLRLVRNAANLGFLHNCNEAALHARGRYLLFLNNDTEPLTGFLDAMVRLAEALPDAGLVGSKLLFPDGRLQEAGGIVWQDATGWNYGRDDNPGLPKYNTVREADYVSGASLLLRRDLFEEMRGFDPLFAPAYYEDTDLAFRVRARGLRVIYQPASRVVHHEGVSHGTDMSSGIKARQEVNRLRMLARWPRMLELEHFSSGVDPMRAAEHARGRRTILIIDHYVPEPDRDAGSRSTMAIVSALKAAGWVVKFWPQNRQHNDYTHLLETMGVEVLDHRLPMGFRQWIEQNGGALDHVLAMRPTVSIEFVSDLMCHTRARLGFYGHDIHHVRMRLQAALTDDARLAGEAEAMATLERRLWHLFDVILYPSEEEAARVRAAVPEARVHAIVPYSYDRFLRRDAPPAEPVMLFVAGFAHPPNIDAARWLVAEILPRVRMRVPDVRLLLAGSHPTDAVRALADAAGGIVVTGSLSQDELEARYRQARAAIVPLRAGAGVKGKVVEALQQGLPLVTTPLGAEGLAGLETVATVSDDPDRLAEALVRLLLDDKVWVAQSAAQLAFVEPRFSRTAFAASLFAALVP